MTDILTKITQYKRKEIVCEVCGEIRASKAVGCDYLGEDE